MDYFLKEKKMGFYVDVGAYHPMHISNTYKFYRRGWKGIQIEPNYNKFTLFQKYRPNTINLNIGVGNREGVMKFFIFEDDAYSTFSEEIVELNKSHGHKLVETKNVPIKPLRKVFAEYADKKEIDFMSVDTEGYDLEVLQTNDWNLYRPRFVVVETMEAGDRLFSRKLTTIDPFMKSVGYEKVADTYLNTIYADKSEMNG
ncbi:MAG: FkbM family methyltransferase [Candidatus Pacebacteria bacterium]|nr:FkbM family methyltransferase [Candidatus Paceibacterota bacterium]